MKVFLAPTLDAAREYIAANPHTHCIETEYGEFEVKSDGINMNHHGDRANNPAPCLYDNLQEQGTCMVSHIDLDTVGGILAIYGIKPAAHSFWEAAAYIDLHGPHHVGRFNQGIQDLLNAYWAYSSALPRVRYTEVTDVTDKVMEAAKVLRDLLGWWGGDPSDPEAEGVELRREQLIEAGRQWASEQLATTEARLLTENQLVRVFITERPFCSASYASPALGICKSTVTYNSAYKTITVAMEDNGVLVNAAKFMQQQFGPDAGGHAGIAGSPRGVEQPLSKLLKVAKALENALEEAAYMRRK